MDMDSTRHLDGNAAAGPLADFLAFDITAAIGRCAGCLGDMAMAQTRLYSEGPGMVLRCPSCDHVMLRLATSADRSWLDMTGVASLQIDRSGMF
jgi:Family of unknown function (DUF6510)